jgi:cytidine deaminase
LESNELATQARKAMKNAYAPYSHLRVGAAVLMTDGKIFTGCNVENAVFAHTICAERTAIVKAISAGSKSIQEVVIASTTEEPLLPCGMCFQTISEFAKNGQVKITTISKKGKTETFRLRELFPSGIRVHRTIKKVLE